jgi:hypothetical protein
VDMGNESDFELQMTLNVFANASFAPLNTDLVRTTAVPESPQAEAKKKRRAPQRKKGDKQLAMDERMWSQEESLAVSMLLRLSPTALDSEQSCKSIIGVVLPGYDHLQVADLVRAKRDHQIQGINRPQEGVL